MNPYRMPKPDKDILFKGTFMSATEGGRYHEGSIFPLFVRLTAGCLWLSRELSIPVRDIKGMELLRNDRALRVDYYHRLEGRMESVCLCAMDLLGIGLYSTRKVRALHKAIDKVRVLEANGLYASAAGAPRAEATGCESCGDSNAAMVHMNSLSCFGLYPLAGIYVWVPRRRFLCRKHAKREALISIAGNALLGNLGFPGFLVTPVGIARTLWSLHKAHRPGWPTILAGALLALVVPAVTTVLILYWLDVITF
jgi:hypothetical protein